MNLTKVISTELDALKRRLIKVLRYGKNDVQTPIESGPYGIDSNPVKDMIAIYAPTGEKGKTVIIGYLNKNQLAGIGEFRTYSTNENGELSFYTWLKNDGTMEIGGNTKNMVRFQELETAFNQLKDDFNTLVGKYNGHVHSGVASGVGVTSTATLTGSTSSANIAPAKIDEIKCL